MAPPGPERNHSSWGKAWDTPPGADLKRQGAGRDHGIPISCASTASFRRIFKLTESIHRKTAVGASGSVIALTAALHGDERWAVLGGSGVFGVYYARSIPCGKCGLIETLDSRHSIDP